jgi:hypothetical protein
VQGERKDRERRISTASNLRNIRTDRYVIKNRTIVSRLYQICGNTPEYLRRAYGGTIRSPSKELPRRMDWSKKKAGGRVGSIRTED